MYVCMCELKQSYSCISSYLSEKLCCISLGAARWGIRLTNFSIFFLVILRLTFKMFAGLLSLVHLDGCPAKTLKQTRGSLACWQILSEVGFIRPDLVTHYPDTYI